MGLRNLVLLPVLTRLGHTCVLVTSINHPPAPVSQSSLAPADGQTLSDIHLMTPAISPCPDPGDYNCYNV